MEQRAGEPHAITARGALAAVLVVLIVGGEIKYSMCAGTSVDLPRELLSRLDDIRDYACEK